jgi:hypothetical protein
MESEPMLPKWFTFIVGSLWAVLVVMVTALVFLGLVTGSNTSMGQAGYPVVIPRVTPTADNCVVSGELTVCCQAPKKPIQPKGVWACQ